MSTVHVKNNICCIRWFAKTQGRKYTAERIEQVNMTFGPCVSRFRTLVFPSWGFTSLPGWTATCGLARTRSWPLNAKATTSSTSKWATSRKRSHSGRSRAWTQAHRQILRFGGKSTLGGQHFCYYFKFKTNCIKNLLDVTKFESRKKVFGVRCPEWPRGCASACTYPPSVSYALVYLRISFLQRCREWQKCSYPPFYRGPSPSQKAGLRQFGLYP